MGQLIYREGPRESQRGEGTQTSEKCRLKQRKGIIRHMHQENDTNCTQERVRSRNIISSRIVVIFSLHTHTRSRVYLARRVFTGDSVRQLCAIGTSTGMNHRVTGRTSSYTSGLSLHHHPTSQRATTNSRLQQRFEAPKAEGTPYFNFSSGFDLGNKSYIQSPIISEMKGQPGGLHLLSLAARGTRAMNSRARGPGRVWDPHFSTMSGCGDGDADPS